MKLISNNGAVIAEVTQYGNNPKVAYGEGVSVMLSNAALKRLADIGECDIRTDVNIDEVPEAANDEDWW